MSEVFIFAGLLAVAFVFLFLHFIVNDVRSLYMAIFKCLGKLAHRNHGDTFHLHGRSIFWSSLDLDHSTWILECVHDVASDDVAFWEHSAPLAYPAKIQRALYVPIFLMPLVVSFSTEGMLSMIFNAFQVVMVISGSYLIYLLVVGYRQGKYANHDWSRLESWYSSPCYLEPF